MSVPDKYARVINPNQTAREIRAQSKFLDAMLRKLELSAEQERVLLVRDMPMPPAWGLRP